jgi:hypothetical protein
VGRPLANWIGQAVSAPGLSIQPLLPQIAVEAYSLPEAFHRDPADRLIVATARVANATLMTRDRQILDYAARGHLTAIAALGTSGGRFSGRSARSARSTKWLMRTVPTTTVNQ